MSISQEDLEDIKLSLTNYPGLSFNDGENPYIEGEWKVTHNGVEIETYRIRILLLTDYPQKLPLVYELSDKIPKIPDRHMNPPDWSACLFVSDERWEIWPIGSSFKKFLEVPVHNFFLWQAYFDMFQAPPPELGERAHGDAGVIQYYYQKFAVTEPQNAARLLLATRYITKRTDRCPCGKNENFGSCHYKIVKEFRDKADPVKIQKAINLFMELIDKMKVDYKNKKQDEISKVLNTSPDQLRRN